MPDLQAALELRGFLRRLSEWDVLNLAPGSGDDGPYWQGEIVKANAALALIEQRLEALQTIALRGQTREAKILKLEARIKALERVAEAARRLDAVKMERRPVRGLNEAVALNLALAALDGKEEG
jgi:hypothetical protein